MGLTYIKFPVGGLTLKEKLTEVHYGEIAPSHFDRYPDMPEAAFAFIFKHSACLVFSSSDIAAYALSVRRRVRPVKLDAYVLPARSHED